MQVGRSFVDSVKSFSIQCVFLFKKQEQDKHNGRNLQLKKLYNVETLFFMWTIRKK